MFRSARSRSYSPDSSDFGNSPIKVVGGRGRSRTTSPSNSNSPRRRPISRSPARAQDRFFLAIGNLTRNVNEGHLKEIFGVYGEILQVSYPMHPNTGYPTGRAVLEYSDPGALEAALAGMNGGQIDGSTIDCSKSKYPTPPLVRLPRDSANARSFGSTRGRGHHRGGYAPPKRRDHSRSPIRRDYGRSPVRRRSISRSRSPVRRRKEYSRSPTRRSPIRRFSRSPARRSPIRRYSRSPIRRYSRSPIRKASRSPVRKASRSPVRKFTHSPVRRFSRSPARRSPGRRFSNPRSPARSRSPRARGPIRRRPSSSYSRSPIRSPRNNRRLTTPSPRRFSPHRRSPSRSPVPVSRMNY